MDYKDKTFEELTPQIIDILTKGGTWWGKFTCKFCGSRQTFEIPNQLYTKGKCEECGHTSELDKWGLLVMF